VDIRQDLMTKKRPLSISAIFNKKWLKYRGGFFSKLDFFLRVFKKNEEVVSSVHLLTNLLKLMRKYPKILRGFFARF
jgi:hypothetical protein